MFFISKFSKASAANLKISFNSASVSSSASKNSLLISSSSTRFWHFLYASVQNFFSFVFFKCFSAFLGSSQKLGASVCDSSSAINASF